MRAPAGISTCCPLWEYTGFVTRQLTGAVPLPSSRLVRTVSMIVPSRSGCSGPAALIGLRSFRRPFLARCRRRGRLPAQLQPRSRCRDGRTSRSSARRRLSRGRPRPRSRQERRSSCRRGISPGEAPDGGDPLSGRSASGRRLRTTLLANRLSYSRRLRSAAIGSSGAGPAGSSKRGGCRSRWRRRLGPPAPGAPPSLEGAPGSRAVAPGSERQVPAASAPEFRAARAGR